MFAGIVDTRDLGFCQVEVTWDESTASDDCSGIAGYDVYRDHGVAHAGETLVASVVRGSPYVDTTPGNGTWVYVVRAVDGSGNEERNQVFQQESEGSCTNDFPRDAGLDRENGIDPPNADHGNSAGGGLRERIETRLGHSAHGDGSLRVRWLPSLDEGGLYPVSYSVLRGDLFALRTTGYTHALVTAGSCGIVEHEHLMPDQLDGRAYYYLVVPVSGDNATFGYDSSHRERPVAPVCE
jgi:hypothetical protein